MWKSILSWKVLLAGLVLCSLTAGLAISCTEPTPSKGGILKIGTIYESPDIGDPVKSIAATALASGGTSLETLLRLDKQGNPIPFLATGWTIDDKNLTITLTLRKGVKFHDGSDFNADAVKYNLERMRDSNETSLKPIKTIDVIDDYTVRLNLTVMDNTIITNLAAKPGLIASPTAIKKNGADWAGKNPIGTGPFTFVSWTRDVSKVFKRFDGYWQKGKPYLDGVEWDVIVDPLVAAAAFQKGEVNVFQYINPKDASDLVKAGNDKYKFVSGYATLIGLCGDSVRPESPFANLKVRQALDYAIDKKAICDALGYGYMTPLNQWSVPTSWEYNPTIPNVPYDPAKAKQLLNEAGYPNGLKVDLLQRNVALEKDVVTACQSYLKAVGIEINVKIVDNANYISAIRGGWTGIIYQAASVTVDPVIRYQNQWLSTGPSWVSAIRTKDLDNLIIGASTTPDLNKKKELIQQAAALLAKNNIVTPLYLSTSVCGLNKNVQNTGMFEVSLAQWTPEEAGFK